MHVHPLRNRLGFDDVQLHDGYLAYYRRADTPSCENQAAADDYFHWLKNEKGIDADVTDTGLECNSFGRAPVDIRRGISSDQLGCARLYRFSAQERPLKALFPLCLVRAAASAV